jgi:hypothetical protein
VADHKSGTFVCNLDAQCTWRYHCLQPWCSMHMEVTFVCKLDAQCTSIIAFHLQAQCPMCMWAAEVLLVLMGCKGDSQECLVLLQFPSMFAAVSFNVCCSNLLQRMDWVSEKKKMHCCERFTGLSLLLLLQCNQTLDSQRKSQPAYQEQQHGESPREEELICNCMLFGFWGARLQLDLSSLQLCAVDEKRKQTWCVGFFF